MEVMLFPGRWIRC